ncbi:MAG: class I SAM-dependent methyltransferase [Candidatus Micrarchaeia archaeon]
MVRKLATDFKELEPESFKTDFERHYKDLEKKPPKVTQFKLDIGGYLYEREKGVLTHFPFATQSPLDTPMRIIAALKTAFPKKDNETIHVAEFATGTGQIGEALENQGYSVAFFDRNAKSINYGKERGIRGGMVADATTVPLKDGSVHAIVSKDFLNSDFPGIHGLNRRVLPEASRILKKGGIVIVDGADKVPYMTWKDAYTRSPLGKCWKLVYTSEPDVVGNYFHVMQKIADETDFKRHDLESNIKYYSAKYALAGEGRSTGHNAHSILAAIKTQFPNGLGTTNTPHNPEKIKVLQIADESCHLEKLLKLEGAEPIITPGEPANLFFGPNQAKNGEIPLSSWKLPAKDSSVHTVVSDGFVWTKCLSRRREAAIMNEAKRVLFEGGILVLHRIDHSSISDYLDVEGWKKIYEGKPAGKSDWMVVLQKQ